MDRPPSPDAFEPFAVPPEKITILKGETYDEKMARVRAIMRHKTAQNYTRTPESEVHHIPFHHAQVGKR